MSKKIENRENKKSSKKKSKIWRAIKIALLLTASLVFAFVAFFAVKIFELDAWDEFDVEKITDASCSLIIYDKDGNEAVRLDSGEDRVPVSIDEVPNLVQKAFISIEDTRFYEHNGIDITRIFGALWADIKAGGYVQGASTISQQLVKLSHLSSEKTITRKLEEAVLAYQMEKAYTKDEILEMYLNFVYFGGGFYGIEAAANGYFGVPCNELTLEQGATLAAILKSPSQYAPHLDADASKTRRNLVLSLMCEEGYISEAKRDEACAKPLVILENVNATSPKRGYYVDEVIKTASEVLDISNDELLQGGYKIYTCMNSSLQEYCEQLFKDGSLFPNDECEGALVIQSSDGGCVEAMIGGRSSETAMAFNRAVDIKRQPGSVIKPIICYAPALESGRYTAATMILDEKCEFGDYAPSNYGDKYNGYVTLRDAVKGSLNIPAVKVLKDISVDTGKAFAQKCGIEFDENDVSLTLALGGFTYGVSPLEIAEAYSVFASGGLHNESVLIREIINRDGETVYRHSENEKRVMSEENAYILTSMLCSAISEGTGRRLGELGYEIAGKTGTVDENNTDGNRDAWMAAYSNEYTAVVWMGYDTSNNKKALPSDATGGKYPALILKEVFAKLYKDTSPPKFKKPQSVISVKLDLRAMQYENKAVKASMLTPADSIKTELFAKGTEPKEESAYWQIPRAAKSFTAQLNEKGGVDICFEMTEDFAVYRLYRVSGNSKILLGEWSGDEKKVAITDESVKKDKIYTYYVMPFHKEMTISNEAVSGIKSKEITIKIPPESYVGTDEIIKDSQSGF